ncbi:hypothetical protein LSTR_LSTR007525 [Laodelphax striatellus]|uniref:ASCH domain-containing protein n=1 Tax=Laodelphax striatellus TaxID=195883 RepID=A0A482XSB3_LAOST|nr:hypothetical protein LSTR_LSTR007525 [Laodelphax striatellus]
MIQYILGIENSRDLEDYLKTLLDFKNEKHKKFFHELVRRKQKANSSQNDLQGSKKVDEMKEYLAPKSSEKKKKSTKNEESSKESKENAEASQGKKKSKFVSIYSAEGQRKDTILLKGRIKCDCQAYKHSLINNCLKCGRIVCEQEGAGPCLFCGNLGLLCSSCLLILTRLMHIQIIVLYLLYIFVCSREQQEILATGNKQSNILLHKLMNEKPDPGLSQALEQRNRLLEYDKTSEKRTRVIDDENDHFSANSVWLSEAERKLLQEREKEMDAAKHSRRNKICLDFAGELMESKQFHLVSSNKLKFSKLTLIGKYIFPYKTVIDETILLPTSAMSLERKGYRVQDKEFLEMTDEGLCLSMHQPWASLLVSGIKEHEGRTWYTAHRGRLWIAAASKPPLTEDVKDIEESYRKFKSDELRFPTEYPVSCLLGCVTVKDCLSQEEYREKYPNGESDSPFVFICEDPQMLPIKFPMQGKHKIYPLEGKIHQAAQKSLQRIAKLKAENKFVKR